MHTAKSCVEQNSGTGFGLVTKRDLAEQLNLSVRSIDNLVRRRAIPIIRLSPRCVRFDSHAVQRALRRFEVTEVGRRA